MRASSVIFAIIIIVMWYLSIFYLVAPHDVHNMLLGGFGLTHTQHQILGVIIFMASLVAISVWAVSGKEEKEEKTVVPPPTTTA